MGSSSCGAMDTLNGGTLINSTIVNGQLTNSSIQGSEFASGRITGSTIDNGTITNSTMTGGRIENSDIVTPTITTPVINQGTATGTKLAECSLETLVKIDDASATLIANALAYLPADSLAALAKAILAQLTIEGPGVIPSNKDVPSDFGDGSLTTCIAGDRNKILGSPDKWIAFADGAVPVYRLIDK